MASKNDTMAKNRFTVDHTYTNVSVLDYRWQAHGESGLKDAIEEQRY